jgi:anti-sigma factor RsiW
MDCTEFKSNLFNFSEGKLSEDLRSSAGQHVSSCTACTKLVAEFKKLEAIIQQEKATEPNPFTATRILQRIEDEFENKPESLENSSSPAWLRVLQPAAIVIALFCGILIGSYSAKKDLPPVNQPVNSTGNIEFLRSNLFITEFADEDKILVINK